MADINIRRRTRSDWIWWVLVVVVITLLLWWGVGDWENEVGVGSIYQPSETDRAELLVRA